MVKVFRLFALAFFATPDSDTLMATAELVATKMTPDQDSGARFEIRESKGLYAKNVSEDDNREERMAEVPPTTLQLAKSAFKLMFESGLIQDQQLVKKAVVAMERNKKAFTGSTLELPNSLAFILSPSDDIKLAVELIDAQKSTQDFTSATVTPLNFIKALTYKAFYGDPEIEGKAVKMAETYINGYSRQNLAELSESIHALKVLRWTVESRSAKLRVATPP
ncbi:unnamed protein product [Hyaloperonospora brassicae]|uniref:RxLR effector candidate protein n=1 Tax=Hyaloperonospora brassicae TaxID=162125 RepID=A0AAV0TW94_HYABA|nr:unnamed protein product [Hyaloperonospora brassicae]